MKNVRIFYRHEDDGAWIGTSPEAPGFVGHGNTYKQTRKRVEEGLPWFLEDDNLLLVHIVEQNPGDQPTAPSSRRVSFSLVAPPPALPFSMRVVETTRKAS